MSLSKSASALLGQVQTSDTPQQISDELKDTSSAGNIRLRDIGAAVVASVSGQTPTTHFDHALHDTAGKVTTPPPGLPKRTYIECHDNLKTADTHRVSSV